MNEATKAAKRRVKDWRFTNRWLVGNGIDIGCGPDPIKKEDYPLIESVVAYDKELDPKADAQFLPDVPDGTYDFVHSSHCLEHLYNTRASLTNWLRVLKPGGFIVCTIPEELLYEFGRWPSRWNPDHKVSFTMRSMPIMPHSQNIVQVLWKLPVDIEHITLLTEHWDRSKAGQDQTLEEAECAIEFVVRKQLPPKVMPF